jgi:3-hydroxymyristoyl/3-hydroxydecanoyl-(acyl carrier protein) dehydratase
MMPLPPVTRRRQGEDGSGFILAIDAELPAFQGHFPGDPVVPGVVLVDWAIRLGQEAFGSQGTFAGLDQIKFLEPVRPGGEVELVVALERGDGGSRLRFQYRSGSGRMASGTVLFLDPS